MTHPLTDEICELIADTEDRLFTSVEKGNMRAAYDLAIEQATDWLEYNVGLFICAESELDRRWLNRVALQQHLESLKEKFIQDFKKAMRLQEES